MPAVIFCNYLWPGLVLVYSVAFGGLKIARPLYLLIGSAIILLALLMEFGWHGVTGVRTPHEWLGICIAILGANLWGLYSAFTKRWSNLPGGAGLTPLFQIATAVIAYVLALFLPASTTGGSGLIWPVLLVGVFNFVAYMCWDVGIRRGSVVTLSLLADFIPWLSLAVTSFLLSVPIGLSTKISAGVLVVGALVARLGTLERKRAP
jgi:drug/metabolite transporter (DMT)-like permease